MKWFHRAFSAMIAVAALAQTPPTLRLPDTVKPVRYAVDLTVDPAATAFPGTIDIDVEVKEPLRVIWLNAVSIEVKEAEVREGGHSMPAKTIPGGKAFIGLETASAVAAGRATLHIVYQGKYAQNQSYGLFLNTEGGERYIFSQFEPISARLAYPCFDEPRFKTPWQVTLRVPRGLSAFSNTPVAKESEEGGLKVVKFAETKPLPSYLVAMAVGPFEVVEAGTAGRKRTPLRIITPRGKAADAAYAARVTKDIVARLENYFGIPYPYEKLDSVAVPLTFGFGAMENAGMITYAQTLILAKALDQTPAFEREYALVGAHEIAHQWVGDLVTTAWWNDIWLNEAFASWMEQKIVAEWHPEWHTSVSDVGSAQAAMTTDELVSARRVRQPIESDNDISNAFDSITYMKGAAVIHMFETWTAAERFRKGVHQYLERHAWGNATAADFLADVSAGSGRNIAPAFSTFLDQPGVPLVSVSLACNGEAAVKLSQQRFLPLGSPGSPPETWQVPVCMAWGSGGQVRRECTLLTKASAEVKLPGKACPEWIDANAGQTGYYRVLYEGDLLARLLENHGRRLDQAGRVGVLGDTRALVNAGRLPAAAALRLAPEFASDPSREVASAAITIAGSVREHLVPEDLRNNYARFIQQTFGPRAREVGWARKPGESDDVRLLRPSLLRLEAIAGHDRTIIDEAKDLALKWLEDRKAVSPDVVGTILSVAAAYGGQSLWDRFHEEAKKTRDLRDRRRLLGAMGDFQDPGVVRRSLDLLLTDEFDIREKLHFLFGPTDYPATRRIPFEFVKEHYSELIARLPHGVGADAGAELPYVASGFCSAAERNETEAFFKDRAAQFSGGPRTLANVLESIGICASVRKMQEPSVAEFLKKY